jgi:hypothetical protein
MFFRLASTGLLGAASAALLVTATACQETGAGNLPSQVPTTNTDRITLPDARREFTSRSGGFAFVVSTRDDWKSLRGTGELFSVAGSTRTLVWSGELPQQYGPRFAIVSDTGTVLMLDEWINVSTPYAVVLRDRNNGQVAQHSTDAVQATLQVPMNEVTRLAKFGWWITAAPVLTSAGDAVRVETGGKILTIRLADGQLSAS